MKKKTLHIELYNEKWCNKLLPTPIPPFTYQHDTPNIPTTLIHSFPSVIKLHKDTHTCPPQPLFEKLDNNFSNFLFLLALHKSLITTYCLFFIQYIPVDSIKPRWFLVQVNHHESEILKMDSLRTGDYHVTLFSRHPADKNNCDDAARWWPEWHEYYLDDSNIPVYCARIFFNPRRKPDLTKYMLWTALVHLTDTSCFLHGPFNSDSQSDIISANQYIALRHWEYLLTFCNELSIIPYTPTHFHSYYYEI